MYTELTIVLTHYVHLQLTSIYLTYLQIADGLQGREKAEILQLCSEVQKMSDNLADLCMSGQGDTEEARNITR